MNTSLQEYPDLFSRHLTQLGIYAYRSATQLNLVDGDVIPKQSPALSTSSVHSPHEHESHEASQSQCHSRASPAASNHATRSSTSTKDHLTLFPHEAKYLIDHVVYLPVHRNVPFEQLDYLLDCIVLALQRCATTSTSSVHLTSETPKLKCKL